jgi:hypothetical protein
MNYLNKIAESEKNIDLGTVGVKFPQKTVFSLIKHSYTKELIIMYCLWLYLLKTSDFLYCRP